jgi:hypothetical protein
MGYVMGTQRKDAHMGKELLFHRDINPHGTLTRLLGSGVVHTEENNVLYYESVSSAHAGDARYVTPNICFINPTTVCRYVTVKPACKSVGDIVELQVSFIMVPLRENKFKVMMVLRSILVLDRTYTQVHTHCLTGLIIFSSQLRKQLQNVSHS